MRCLVVKRHQESCQATSASSVVITIFVTIHPAYALLRPTPGFLGLKWPVPPKSGPAFGPNGLGIQEATWRRRDDAEMLLHPEERMRTKTMPFRRNRKGRWALFGGCRVAKGWHKKNPRGSAAGRVGWWRKSVF